ncbi:unnamed protein product [Lactuca saligna]|uniref:PB1-like domain-containing protein n=1 Tax=Lactuca saligna TaxID=75948 RepID=A0AA35UP23_LACSI|nr:unnamed protein product [Lactuca saligna]
MVSWCIRSEMDEIDVDQSYVGHLIMFSIRMHHGGEFTSFPGRKYIRGKQTFVNLLDTDTFFVHDIDEMMEYLGCASVEHEETTFHTYLMSPTHSKVRITEITEPPSCSKRLFLEWHGAPAVDLEDGMDHMEKELGNDPTRTGHMEKDLGNDATLTDHMDNDLESENDESDDSDFFVDIDNILDDINVDMQDFEMNIDKDVEWVGGSSNTVVDEGTHDEALEEINTDFLASDSSSNEGINGQIKKSIRAIQRAHENDEALISEPFYIFQ